MAGVRKCAQSLINVQNGAITFKRKVIVVNNLPSCKVTLVSPAVRAGFFGQFPLSSIFHHSQSKEWEGSAGERHQEKGTQNSKAFFLYHCAFMSSRGLWGKKNKTLTLIEIQNYSSWKTFMRNLSDTPLRQKLHNSTAKSQQSEIWVGKFFSCPKTLFNRSLWKVIIQWPFLLRLYAHVNNK